MGNGALAVGLKLFLADCCWSQSLQQGVSVVGILSSILLNH